jgi:hypothetical protein
VEELLVRLKAALPDDWSVSVRDSDRRFSSRPNALLAIEDPDGTSAVVAVEVKRNVQPRDIERMLAQVRRYPADAALIMAPYLTDRARELIQTSGSGYADATGNLRLALRRPAVFITSSGESSDPWRTKRPVRSLKGAVAGRGIRALCDFRPPYGVRELAARANMIPGTLSRLLVFLEEEALIRRDGRGRVDDVDWPALLRRWTADYSFSESNETQGFLEPRGLAELERKLVASSLRYAVSGSLATRSTSPVAPPRLGVVYVEAISRAAAELQLTPTDSGINVILAEPFDSVVFERQRSDQGGLKCAALPQVAVDLMTGPGRSPSEAEALIRWMQDNEDAWRA